MLNRLTEMIQWLTHKDCHLFCYQMNQRFSKNRFNEWFNDILICFVPELFCVFELLANEDHFTSIFFLL